MKKFKIVLSLILLPLLIIAVLFALKESGKKVNEKPLDSRALYDQKGIDRNSKKKFDHVVTTGRVRQSGTYSKKGVEEVLKRALPKFSGVKAMRPLSSHLFVVKSDAGWMRRSTIYSKIEGDFEEFGSQFSDWIQNLKPRDRNGVVRDRYPHELTKRTFDEEFGAPVLHGIGREWHFSLKSYGYGIWLIDEKESTNVLLDPESKIVRVEYIHR